MLLLTPPGIGFDVAAGMLMVLYAAVIERLLLLISLSELGEFTFSLLFWHPRHLHLSPQTSPALKHSQYFLIQPDFLQLHPASCATWRRLLNAFGLRLSSCCMAILRSFAASSLFLHSLHLQSDEHRMLAAKQSQYSLRHRLFLQVHGLII